MTPTTKIHCDHCRQELVERVGNTIVVDNLEVEFKRSTYITCRNCGKQTRFLVDRKSESA